MENKITTRYYRYGDEDEIIQLLHSTFINYAKDKSFSDYWRWKYFDPPLGSIIRVATIEDKIVGVGHSVLLNVKIGDDIVLGNMSGDAATHSDYRGLGIYSKLDKFNDISREERGVKFAYSISGNPIILKTKRNVPRVAFPKKISYMVRIHDVGLHLKNRPRSNQKVLRFGYRFFKFINRIIRLYRNAPVNKNDFVLEEIKQFDSSVDRFWNKIKGNYNFILEKNQRYLNWRYCDSRGGDFYIFKADNGEELLGFVVVQLVQSDGYYEGLLVDLLTIPDRLDVTNALMRHVCEFLDNKDVNVIYYECVDGHPFRYISLINGFVDSLLGPSLRCIMGDDLYNIINTSPPSKIYFNYGDLF